MTTRTDPLDDHALIARFAPQFAEMVRSSEHIHLILSPTQA